MYTEKDLSELEQYFKSVTLPEEIQLTQCEKVVDVKKFINTQLANCRAGLGLKTFDAAFDRLVKLKDLLHTS